MLSLTYKENLEDKIFPDNFEFSVLHYLSYSAFATFHVSHVILLAVHYILSSVPCKVTSMEKQSDSKWFGTLTMI